MFVSQKMRLSIARWSPFLYMLPNVLWLQSPKRSDRSSSYPWIEFQLTLKERWNPVTSAILFCTILLRFGVWGGSDQDMRRQWFLNQFALLRNKQNRFRERRKWSHCASWSAWCGALNGSPVDDTIWDPSVTIQCKKHTTPKLFVFSRLWTIN